MLSNHFLKQILNYDPATGVFTWKVTRGRMAKAGAVAGRNRKDGYREIGVMGKRYLSHCLSWFYMTGRWPTQECDHRNGIKDDNKWNNLREATRSTNMQNLRAARADNKTGLLGVSLHGKKFRAQIYINGKRTALGSHNTALEASNVYLAAKRKLHTGCTI